MAGLPERRSLYSQKQTPTKRRLAVMRAISVLRERAPYWPSVWDLRQELGATTRSTVVMLNKLIRGGLVEVAKQDNHGGDFTRFALTDAGCAALSEAA